MNKKILPRENSRRRTHVKKNVGLSCAFGLQELVRILFVPPLGIGQLDSGGEALFEAAVLDGVEDTLCKVERSFVTEDHVFVGDEECGVALFDGPHG